MSKNLTYTTGQVSGMTQLSFMSLTRYVKFFSEFFSPEVAKHTRGRRWLEDDILVVVSIQNLFTKRMGVAAIREELRSGWRLDMGGESSPEMREKLSELYETCQLYRQEAKADRETAHTLTIALAAFRKRSHDDHERLLNLEKAILRQEQDIQKLYTKKAFISFGR